MRNLIVPIKNKTFKFDTRKRNTQRDGFTNYDKIVPTLNWDAEYLSIELADDVALVSVDYR